LTLNGTEISASLTDSDGNTINTPALDLAPTFATQTYVGNQVASQISALNLSQYAKTADLNALATRVSDLETTTAGHETRIDTIETNYVSSTALTTALGNYYTKSQTYSKDEVYNKDETYAKNETYSKSETYAKDEVYNKNETYTRSEVDAKLTAQNLLPTTCTDGQVVKYNTTTTAWECANDNDTTEANGSPFATQQWVSDQAYATTTALSAYLKKTELAGELATRITAGTGINITSTASGVMVTSTAETDVFEVVPDHTAVATPNPNKIYIDTSTTPASQWAYENSTWVKIGEVNTDMANYYTKDQTDSAISNEVAGQITSNNANYTTTADLNTLLAAKANQTDLDTTNGNLTTTNNNLAATNTNLSNLSDNLTNNYTTTSDLNTMLTTKLNAKQDKLPTCTNGQVVKYNTATTAWECADDKDTTTDLTGYATESWVEGKGYLVAANLNSEVAALGYATQSWVNDANNTGYVKKSTLDTTLADYTTTADMNTKFGDYSTTTQTDALYVPKSALNCSTTQALVGTGTNGTVDCRAIQDISSGALTQNNSLITANTLAATLGNYYKKTETDALLNDMVTSTGGKRLEFVTVMPDTSAQDPNTVYFLLEP
jgi:hypothetical protein